jgi:hypothetical protein
MKEYNPEIGQMMFGQPYQKYECSNLLQAALDMIDKELCRIMWNINQEEYKSPFQNTANSFKCDIFEVEAYSWNDDYKQKYNFKYRDIEISWYKYLGRGTSINRLISNDKIEILLEECLEALQKYEKENCENF